MHYPLKSPAGDPFTAFQMEWETNFKCDESSKSGSYLCWKIWSAERDVKMFLPTCYPRCRKEKYHHAPNHSIIYLHWCQIIGQILDITKIVFFHILLPNTTEVSNAVLMKVLKLVKVL